MTVITICQKKGGNGKSTSCQNLSWEFARLGSKVLVIDLDEQGNTSSVMRIEEQSVTIDEVLAEGGLNRRPLKRLSRWEMMDFLGTRGGLTGVARELDGETGGHQILKERLREIAEGIEGIDEPYNYCFIDTSPSMNILTLNALCASDYVFIPLSSKYFSMEGLEQTMESIGKVQKRLNEGLKVLGMGFVIHDGRSVFAREMIELVREKYGELVCKTVINQNIKIEIAQYLNQTIQRYDRNNRGAIQYGEMAWELYERLAAEWEERGKRG